MTESLRPGISTCEGGDQLIEEPDGGGHDEGEYDPNYAYHPQDPIAKEVQCADGVQGGEAENGDRIQAVLVVDLNNANKESSKGQ